MFFLRERRSGPEILDLPAGSCSREELEGTLADLRVVNRRLGDVAAVVRHVSALAAGLPRPVTVLDIATGSGDIPAALAQWGRRTGVPLEITAIDFNGEVIEVARTVTAGYPEITLAVADALLLPFAPRSFDIVLCCKTFHHFPGDEATRVLQEILRVARRGYLVLDLRRSIVAWLLIWLITRLFTRNRVTRNDGPLSVLRAFTPDELAGVARQAGAAEFRVVREPFWLMALSGKIR